MTKQTKLTICFVMKFYPRNVIVSVRNIAIEKRATFHAKP